MIVTRLILKNWRNFRDVDVELRERTFLIGANATGKSNILDVFRFLHDVSKPQGGGLQKAIADRGGIRKVRCLHARKDPEVRIEVHLSHNSEEKTPTWRYILGFKAEGKGAHRTLVSIEQVWKKGSHSSILERPNPGDETDYVRLTQTALEQIQANSAFREVSDFFSETSYLHLVPQLLKYGDQIGGQRLEDDPFGQGFLERIAKTSGKVRESRLRRIGKALALAVPQFRELRFIKDGVTGRPHLEAMYSHYRPNAGWQGEEQFSDGTLRLLALLWALADGESLLLLEEPELSLNDAIVREIPSLIDRIQRDKKRRSRQVIITTHSEALLSNPGIDARGVLLLEPGPEGTTVRAVNNGEAVSISAGLSIAEVVLPKTRPAKTQQLALW
jgi:predicted ATPase